MVRVICRKILLLMTGVTLRLHHFKLKTNIFGVALSAVSILMRTEQWETCFFVQSLYISYQPALWCMALSAIITKGAAVYIFMTGKAVLLSFIKNQLSVTLAAVNTLMLSGKRKCSSVVIKLHWFKQLIPRGGSVAVRAVCFKPGTVR